MKYIHYNVRLRSARLIFLAHKCFDLAFKRRSLSKSNAHMTRKRTNNILIMMNSSQDELIVVDNNGQQGEIRIYFYLY